ncbi:MAG: hypothetical protein ICV64_02910 [Thermoleophilia bacterium]|nr:hypothetical protein [Thermoleophilia bacterium]
MSVEAPTNVQLDEIRRQADRFVCELNEELYRHYAGLKETLELAAIYARYPELTSIETARAVGAAVDGDVRTRWLWRFACEGYLGERTKAHEERVAALEAELVTEVDGEPIPFRMLRPAIANEPDRARRRRLEEARSALVEAHLVPLQLERQREAFAGARALGADSYLELYRDRLGVELDRLAEQCRALLDETESLWLRAGDRLFRERVGVGLEEAERWDVPRVQRAPTWDGQFPGTAMTAALEATLAELGIDLRAQENVRLDIEHRPRKSPRAFCAPIEVPSRVMLVIQPIGGADDWFALFHEAGHAEHFAHASAELSFEERRLGDDAVTEGWAALLERLVRDPAWLTRRLDFSRPEDFAREEAATELWYLRRYCAKLLYELELHASDEPERLRDRYVELLTDALEIAPSASDFVGDVDPGFYASSYLRSWAFEAQLRDFLRDEFGSRWFARREAGGLLRELWSLGQRPTAEELLADATGQTLEMAAAAERIRESF